MVHCGRKDHVKSLFTGIPLPHAVRPFSCLFCSLFSTSLPNSLHLSPLSEHLEQATISPGFLPTFLLGSCALLSCSHPKLSWVQPPFALFSLPFLLVSCPHFSWVTIAFHPGFPHPHSLFLVDSHQTHPLQHPPLLRVHCVMSLTPKNNAIHVLGRSTSSDSILNSLHSMITHCFVVDQSSLHKKVCFLCSFLVCNILPKSGEESNLCSLLNYLIPSDLMCSSFIILAISAKRL